MGKLMIGGVAAASLAIAASAAAAAPPTAPRAALPVSESDICAIVAQPEMPGIDLMGDPKRVTDPDSLRWETRWRAVGWTWEPAARKFHGDWGSCSVPHIGFNSLQVSEDGRYALTEGGWQAGPIAGGEGYCVFEKFGAAWKAIVCTLTAIS